MGEFCSHLCEKGFTCDNDVFHIHSSITVLFWCISLSQVESLPDPFQIQVEFSFLAGAAPKYVCTYYDVVEYLNISSHSKLHTHILPKSNSKEPLEVKMDFMLVAILSVVRT